MATNEVTSLSCVQLAAAIRERRTSCVAAMEAVLARARAVQPRLNCFLRVDEEAALAAAPTKAAYARVDMVRDNDGKLAIIELELIEPALWLQHAPDGGASFASAFRAGLPQE